MGLVQDPDQFRADPDPTFHSAAENIPTYFPGSNRSDFGMLVYNSGI